MDSSVLIPPSFSNRERTDSVLQNREPRKPLSRTALAAIALICALILAAFFIGFEYSAPNGGALVIPGGSQQSP